MKPIETKTPPELPPLTTRKRELTDYLMEMSAEYLRNGYTALFGMPAPAKTKREIAEAAAERLNFPTATAFREWFFALPALTQAILYAAAFTDYLSLKPFEKESDTALLVAGYSWRFNPVLRLDVLPFLRHYGCPATFLPKYLRAVLSLWLAPPSGYYLSSCRLEKPPASAGWDNSRLIGEMFPLLCDTVRTAIEQTEDREKLLRGGFKKRDIAELRASTDFQPFLLGGAGALDSVDLAARFVLCMFNCQPERPEDGQDGIRKMMQAFFSGERHLEYTICIDHLSRTAGNYLGNPSGAPESRKAFYGILLEIARDGGWFSADRTAEYLRISGTEFSFCDKSLEKSLKLKADTLTLDGQVFNAEYREFHPEGLLRHYLLVRPLFKAYCYICAVFGLVEIIQERHPFYRTYNGREYPVSPYDSLKAVRITPFGLWCLGLAAEPPRCPSQEYQAIADRELFLVTVQGNSLERRVYLDKIGQPLGEDRWRVTPASFIAGCVNQRQIGERIERFKLLIDPAPAAHWEELFKNAVDRAGLFDESRADIIVYDLPADPEIAEQILRDPEIKRIIRRVEGRMLAVHVKDQRMFHLLLGGHGIAHF